jgi:hypothetical protein
MIWYRTAEIQYHEIFSSFASESIVFVLHLNGLPYNYRVESNENLNIYLLAHLVQTGLEQLCHFSTP